MLHRSRRVWKRRRPVCLALHYILRTLVRGFHNPSSSIASILRMERITSWGLGAVRRLVRDGSAVYYILYLMNIQYQSKESFQSPTAFSIVKLFFSLRVRTITVTATASLKYGASAFQLFWSWSHYTDATARKSRTSFARIMVYLIRNV